MIPLLRAFGMPMFVVGVVLAVVACAVGWLLESPRLRRHLRRAQRREG